MDISVQETLPCGQRRSAKLNSSCSSFPLRSTKERGGEVAARLVSLYDYMQLRLTEANVEQREEPLAEVGRLIDTLLEAWQNCKAPVEKALSSPHYEDELSMAGVLTSVSA
ncbi:MAG: flagellar export chaperone FliS [Bryobacteraceae bacterium]